MDKSSSGRVTLGEQAAALQNPHDRVMALRRVTAAAQVLLARTMVMRALSLLSVRYNIIYCIQSFTLVTTFKQEGEFRRFLSVSRCSVRQL